MPHSHITRRGDPSDFFGSDVLAKKDFLGSMKDARIFGVVTKTEGFFGVVKKGLRDFSGMLKKVMFFFG